MLRCRYETNEAAGRLQETSSSSASLSCSSFKKPFQTFGVSLWLCQRRRERETRREERMEDGWRTDGVIGRRVEDEREREMKQKAEGWNSEASGWVHFTQSASRRGANALFQSRKTHIMEINICTLHSRHNPTFTHERTKASWCEWISPSGRETEMFITLSLGVYE